MSPALPPGLDHLAFGGPDLAETVALVAQLTGVEAAPGGRHVDRGTANYLIGLGGGTYLEIIGPDPQQPHPARARWFGLDDVRKPRLLTWALRPTNLDATVSSARTAGYDPGRTTSMSRRADDGTVLHWRLTPDTVGSSDAGVVPFLIDWAATTHPSARELPALELRALTATHPDVERVSGELAALGTALDVGPGRAGLIAVLAGPYGEVLLR